MSEEISLGLRLTLDESREVLRALDEFRKAEALRKKAVEVLETSQHPQMTSAEREVAGRNKIAAIKLVRERLGCGLKEAKDIVEGVGSFGPHPFQHP